MSENEDRLSAKKRSFSGRLLAWHKQKKISYPWRETGDPYRILVTEMLLRKTTRKQVMKIYPKFFGRYPDIESLSESQTDEIETLITPLGMEHRKALLLKSLAQKIVSQFSGKVPLRRNELLGLQGVGDYTANAVLLFATSTQEPLVDTNMVRVVHRVFSFQSGKKRPRTDRRIWSFVRSLLPEEKAREFNLAVLDFAATICLPRNPKCPLCLLIDICDHGIKLAAEAGKP